MTSQTPLDLKNSSSSDVTRDEVSSEEEDLSTPLQEQYLQEAKDTHKLRLSYSNRIFFLVVGWLLCVIASLVLDGFRLLNFDLSDGVLIAFITTTTTAVIGLFIVVANWMFPKQKSS